MITLITGVPGGGKTLYCIHEILRKQTQANDKLIAEGKDPRKIFVDGIPGLLLPHDLAGDINDWHKWATDGSLIIVDEVQRIWRPAGMGKGVPESIAQLETHRHRGIDFVILTQHPMLIHSNVRNLIGKHIHLRRTAFGVYAYEWSECVNPSSAWKTAITRVKWSHPKSSFGLYKSAEIHNEVKFRIPPALMLLCFALLAFAFLGYRLYSSFTEATTVAQSVTPAPRVQPKNLPSSSPPSQSNSVHSKDLHNQNIEIEKYHRRLQMLDNPVQAFQPRLDTYPETAPAYDEIRQVKTMPRIAGCIASDSDCRCFTQQGTVVAMSLPACRLQLSSVNRRFDPYRSENAS